MKAPPHRPEAVRLRALAAPLVASALVGLAACEGAAPIQPGPISHVLRTLSVGQQFACAIRENGTLWCWGANDSGQLGGGTTAAESASPVQVGTGTDWVDISCGLAHACGLHASHELDCWGSNMFGQVGVDITSSATVAAPPPVARPGDWPADVAWVGVAQGIGNHQCALDSRGLAYCWGPNDLGELGTGGGYTSIPTLVIGGPWSDVVTGAEHTCALLANAVECWGWNAQEQTDPGDAASELETAVVVNIGRDWTGVSAGMEYSCALSVDGAILCWGGFWGAGLAVGGTQHWTRISSGWSATCALRSDGGLWCWVSGLNDGGAATGPPTQPAPLNAKQIWVDIAVGAYLGCARTQAGAIYCWSLDGSGNPGGVTPVGE